jgi:hypothetical protein
MSWMDGSVWNSKQKNANNSIKKRNSEIEEINKNYFKITQSKD